MNWRWMLSLVVGSLAAWSLLPGCKCGGDDILAKLTEADGTIYRDWASQVGQWKSADIGTEFTLGDGVKSDKESGAVLLLSEGSYVRLAPQSIIRFLDVPPEKKDLGAKGITVEAGEAELVVGENPITLLTSVGMASLEAGSRIRILALQSKGLEFRVQIGRATFFDRQNTSHVVREGEGITISIGAAILERFAKEPPVVVMEAPEKAEPAKVEVASAEQAVEPADTEAEAEEDEAEEEKGGGGSPGRPGEIGEGPDYADFSVLAGDSFIVHTAKPPVALELRFEGQCPGGAAVHVGKRFVSKGASSANVLLKAGRRRYRVHCLDKAGLPASDAAVKGSVLVVKDSGVSRIPTSAPSTAVEADGRRYKVMYQNRLPNITVKWPEAPTGQKYILYIESDKGKQSKISIKQPEHLLAAGELTEGIHRVKFEAIGSMSRTSRVTTIEISFDNAAPKASISEPRDGAFHPGSRVAVSGVTVSGWKIAAGGQILEMDEQYRFKGEVVHDARYRAIALRLSHPKRGVHYYLRRASGQSN